MPINQPIEWKTATGNDALILDGLQPNILKGHIRDSLTILFLKFANANGAKKFLKALATPQAGKVLVKSAKKHLQEVETFKQSNKTIPGTAYVGVGLTWNGYNMLGIPVAKRPGDQSFKNGMKLADLNDPPSSQWELEYRGTIDAVVLVGDAKPAPRNVALNAVKALIATSPGVSVIGSPQEGLGQHNDNDDGIEHFGYVDGRSQPLFLVEDLKDEKLHNDGATNWDPKFNPDRVILPDPAAPNQTTDFGSYFVYRKLEQNVKRFKTEEAALATRLGLKGKDKERAGAMIVGRFEDGTPVSMQFAEGTHNPVVNDFTYDSDPSGGKCPHFAHIRKVNPRGTGGFEPVPGERLHIMARRGQTYGTRTDGPNDGKLANKPTKDVGLLFMAFNVKIAEQFEFAQSTWANNPAFPSASTPPGLDLVIGQMPGSAARPKITCPKEWSATEASKKMKTDAVPQAVTMKGGEYFFMPSLPFLKSL
jgi:Dyp-type peroxidase family